jgi:F-type H+-transporting ATPase subunit delta
MHSSVKVYTQALFEVSKDLRQCDQVHKDLKNILQIIKNTSELETFLRNPAIPSTVRQNAIEKIFKKFIQPISYQFIKFLEYKNRLSILKETCTYFESLYLDEQGVARVKITSSVDLSGQQVKEITGHLKKRLKKEIEPDLHVDAKMIAGIMIQHGDIVYDYSARTQLDRFRNNLIKA